MKLFGYEITIKKVVDVGSTTTSTRGHVKPDKPWPRLTTFETVQMLIHKNCGNYLDEIKPESTPCDLSLDSLDEVELLMAVEEKFDIEIPMEEWEACINVGEVCYLIDKTLDEGKD